MDEYFDLQHRKLAWLGQCQGLYGRYVQGDEWIVNLNADEWATFLQLIQLSENEQ